ncbi:hypothetical protein BG015_010959, partial [Linnemannia schmuckeri]
APTATAMTTACARFFSLPELVVHLLPFLSKHDLLHLLLTNHALKAICAPVWWQSVDFTNESTSIDFISAPQTLIAFGDNISSVQSFTCEPNSSWYYMNALWTYLNSTSDSEAY